MLNGIRSQDAMLPDPIDQWQAEMHTPSSNQRRVMQTSTPDGRSPLSCSATWPNANVLEQEGRKYLAGGRKLTPPSAKDYSEDS
jgi:hypothetical protein